MFSQVAHLAKLNSAGWACKRSFICVRHHMRVELAHPSDYLVADSVALEVFLAAFEELILLLVIVEFLDEIEDELIAGGNMTRVAVLSRVEVCSIDNGYVVVALDVILSHEFGRQDDLTFVKIQL